MFRPAAFFVIGITIYLAVFAARVSGKMIVKKIQQTDLEAMLSLSRDMTNKPPSWRPDVAACDWYNNGQPLCNAAGSVTGIHWEGLSLGGSANLKMLPQGLTSFSLYTNNLTGVAELAFLPQGLQDLWLDDNAFSGCPNLTSLPQGLQQLYLDSNLFSGSGTFAPRTGPLNWCTIYPAQTDMCGTHDAAFNCSSGVWSCTP